MNIQTIFDIFAHIDKNLAILIQNYGILVYPILFLILFCETGLVIFPFLPGDSLLFAAGALAGAGFLNIFALFILAAFAAILGDTVNYWIGYSIGKKAFKEDSRFFRKEYLLRTQNFYEKYGGKTIILARFVPIIRTFAPFIAGIGRMRYARFIAYNIVGGLAWVFLFVFMGYFFGGLPLIQRNFSIFILIIIVVSIIPLIVEAIRSRRK